MKNFWGKVEIMEKAMVTRYFLGANSRYGFYSLYDRFINPAAGDFLWVIKGGPGCGKSSFMRKIGAAAEEAGLPVEYIHCSGDPDSLDGVVLPELRCAVADGTSPHAAAPLGHPAKKVSICKGLRGRK